MMGMGSDFKWFCIGMAILMLIYEIGFMKGTVAVASGKYRCELVKQTDQTTEWECLENSKIDGNNK